MVGGIGFTMALFIAQLAFPAGALLETSKFAILLGSAAAGILSLLIGFKALPDSHGSLAAVSEAEAEASTLR
jgi:NhaA family Na+:H+ antiporter